MGGMNEAGLVIVAHIDHVRREFRIDRDVADLDDARLAILEHGSACVTRHVLRIDDDADPYLRLSAAFTAGHLTN